MHPSDLPQQFNPGQRLTAAEVTALARAARSEQRAPGFVEADGQGLPPRPVTDGGQLFDVKNSNPFTVPEYSLFAGFRQHFINRAEPPALYLERDVQAYTGRRPWITSHRGLLLTNGEQRVVPGGYVRARQVRTGDVLKLRVTQIAGLKPTIAGQVCRVSVRADGSGREYFTLRRDFANDGDFIVLAADTGDPRYAWFERVEPRRVAVVRCEEGLGGGSPTDPYVEECWAYEEGDRWNEGRSFEPLFEADGTTHATRLVYNTYWRSVVRFADDPSGVVVTRDGLFSPWLVQPAPYYVPIGGMTLTCVACGDPIEELELWLEPAGLAAGDGCDDCPDLSCGLKLGPLMHIADGFCGASSKYKGALPCEGMPAAYGSGRLLIEYTDSPPSTTVTAFTYKWAGKHFYAFKKVVAARLDCVDDLCDLVLDPTTDLGDTWCDQSAATLTVRCTEPTMCGTTLPPTTTTTPDPDTTTTTTWDPDATTTGGSTSPYPTTTTTLPASTTTVDPSTLGCDGLCGYTWYAAEGGHWELQYMDSGCGDECTCSLPDNPGTVEGETTQTSCYGSSTNPCRSYQCSWIGIAAGAWTRVSADYICASPCACPAPSHASYFGELAFTNCNEGA